MSRLMFDRVRLNLRILPRRRSSWLNRSPYVVPGWMSATDVVPVATGAGFGNRPSDAATSVFGAAYVAAYSIPGILWYDAPNCTSIFGTVYEPRNFTCGSHF